MSRFRLDGSGIGSWCGMDRVIIILSVLFITLLGFIIRFIEYKRIFKRMDMTYDYRNRLIGFFNDLTSRRFFDDEVYISLVEDVSEMQIELGEDGIIAFLQDNLSRLQVRNYQILANFLPKLREYLMEVDEFSMVDFMKERYYKEMGYCDNAFINHIGKLKSLKESTYKMLINPIYSFTYGVAKIIFIPLWLLTSFGVLSTNIVKKIKRNKVVNFLTGIIALIAFASSVISIVVGWERFIEIVQNLFNTNS